MDSAGTKRDQAASPVPAPRERRNFLVQAAAVVIGGLVGFFPLLVGLRTFFAPLSRKKAGGEAVRIALLDSLRDPSGQPSGVPLRFPVITERTDAWTKYPPEPIGAVYLRWSPGEDQPRAFTSVCPHLGCSVSFKPELDEYRCPCHNSSWKIDGERIEPSPAPRNLDELAVEIREVEIDKDKTAQEVWVVYERFRPGVEAKEVV